MEVQRPAEAAFAHLPGYAYAPHYRALAAGLRMHFVDEGVPEHPTVLLLHGLPGWSYAYRRMMPILIEAGCRVVAPDLIGCGRSDRPVDPAAHGYEAHVGWLGELLAALDLREVALVGDDLGALLGLRLVADRPERFASVIALNPCLPGEGPLPPGPARWVELSRRPADRRPSASSLVRELVAAPLSNEAAAGYDAPAGVGAPAMLDGLGGIFADPAARAATPGVLARLARFTGRFAIAASEPDPASRAAADSIFAAVPGARWIDGAPTAAGRRLICEDRGPELAHVVLGSLSGGPRT